MKRTTYTHSIIILATACMSFVSAPHSYHLTPEKSHLLTHAKGIEDTMDNEVYELYVYLKFEKYDREGDTYYLIVSDYINYTYYKDNILSIHKKFAAEAMTNYSLEVWTPGIKDAGINENLDEVKIKRGKEVKFFQDNNKRLNQNHKVHFVSLNLL